MDLLLWTDIDHLKIPYVYRSGERFIAVRMIEAKLLSKYPRRFIKQVDYSPALTSHYMTQEEANVFNACDDVFRKGMKRDDLFTRKDLVIKLDDFQKYHRHLKEEHKRMQLGCNNDLKKEQQEARQNVINSLKRIRQLVASEKSASNASTCKDFTQDQAKSIRGAEKMKGGWIQIHNTIVPYFWQDGCKFLPVSVLKMALEIDVKPLTKRRKVTAEELAFLNSLCAQACIEFKFSAKTRVTSCNQFIDLYPHVFTKDLMTLMRPLQEAAYHPEFSTSLIATGDNRADDKTSTQKSDESSLDDVTLGANRPLGGAMGLLGASCERELKDNDQQMSASHSTGPSYKAKRFKQEAPVMQKDDQVLDLSLATALDLSQRNTPKQSSDPIKNKQFSGTFMISSILGSTTDKVSSPSVQEQQRDRGASPSIDLEARSTANKHKTKRLNDTINRLHNKSRDLKL